MFSVTPANPLMNAPPDKVETEQGTYPQQIVFFASESVDAPNHEFESDVDSQLSGYNVDGKFLSILNFLQYSGMPSLTTVGSTGSEPYATPSPSCGDSDSGHSTTGPLTPSPNFDYISLEAGSSDYDYKEELLISDEGVHSTPRGRPGEAFQGVGFDFGTLAHAPSVPCLSASISTSYGHPLWQQMDSAAAADARGLPGHGYLVAGPFPSTGVHSLTEPRREEVVSHIHPGVSWSHDTSVDEGRAAVPSADGAINPALLTMPITQTSYRYSPQASLYGQEQPQVQHFGVAPADALGLGSGIPGDPRQVVVPQPLLLPLQTTASESPHPRPPRTAPRQHVDKGRVNVSSKKPATKARRKQSIEKVFACPWSGCKAAFARTNNLKVHEKGVHCRVRDHVCPFAGCAKAENGFSRKYDLEVHVQKHHAAELGNMPAA